MQFSPPFQSVVNQKKSLQIPTQFVLEIELQRLRKLVQ
jgi:hypothetical protein